MKKLCIAWVSLYSQTQKRGGWQGANYSLLTALKNQNIDLEIIAPLESEFDLWAKWKSRFLTATVQKRLVWNCSNRTLAMMSKKFSEIESRKKIDYYLFFGSSGFFEIFPKKPWGCYLDSAFTPFLDFQARHRNYLHSEYQRLSALENKWFEKANAIFTSSKFAKETILKWYNTKGNNIFPVGIGPNLTLDTIPDSPRTKSPRILFIGSNFLNKGGDIAIKAVGLARREIQNLEINIVGQTPPDNFRSSYVHIHGWIDRENNEGRLKWNRLMAESSLLLSVPKYDLTPNAICESFAYGLPVLSYSVGGIPEMLNGGASGWLIPQGTETSELASKIVNIFSNQKNLEEKAQNARESYQNYWNWNKVSEKIIEVIHHNLNFDLKRI